LFRLDDSLYPLIVVTAGNEIAERDVDALDAAFDEVFARGGRFAIVTRSYINRFPSGNVRARIAAWGNRPDVRSSTALLNVGHAYVLESPLVRGAMTAIFWVWDPPNPQYAAATYEAGLDWAVSRLLLTDTLDAVEASRIRKAALSATA
jgi:hypothetical protein